MTRLSTWEANLAAYIAKHNGQPFVYGERDCCLWAAGAAAAQTGVDNAAVFRGKYTTELGAAKALRKYGAGSIEATFDSFYPERPIAFARRGDLVFNGEAVGVCVGATALFLSDDGYAQIPRAQWQKAWAI
ncbi:MAG: DUF6950 family protein [Blastomonas sp.]